MYEQNARTKIQAVRRRGGRIGRVMGRLWGGWLVLVGVSAVSPAIAGPSAEELAVARELYEKAVGAEANNDWQTCQAALSEALGILETPGLRFHHAYCKEQQGHWIEALVDYKRAEELIHGGVEASDVEPLLQPAIGRLEAKVPRLVVRVHDAPEQLTFYLDAKERSPRLLGKALQLNPGSHSVEVSAPGYHAASRSVSLKEGERGEVSLRLEPNGEPRRTELAGAGEVGDGGAVQRDRKRGISPKPFVLAAEGALVATGVGLGIFFLTEREAAFAARAKARNSLSTVDACAPMAAATLSDADAQRCKSIAHYVDEEGKMADYAKYSFIGAGAAAAVLATTWLAWDDRPRVIVALDPWSRSASFGLRGEF